MSSARSFGRSVTLDPITDNDDDRTDHDRDRPFPYSLIVSPPQIRIMHKQCLHFRHEGRNGIPLHLWPPFHATTIQGQWGTLYHPIPIPSLLWRTRPLQSAAAAAAAWPIFSPPPPPPRRRRRGQETNKPHRSTCSAARGNAPRSSVRPPRGRSERACFRREGGKEGIFTERRRDRNNRHASRTRPPKQMRETWAHKGLRGRACPTLCSFLFARIVVLVLSASVVMRLCTEMRFIPCTWFGEFCSCCSLTALPGPAWVLLNKICKELISSLYTCSCSLAVSLGRSRLLCSPPQYLRGSYK